MQRQQRDAEEETESPPRARPASPEGCYGGRALEHCPALLRWVHGPLRFCGSWHSPAAGEAGEAFARAQRTIGAKQVRECVPEGTRDGRMCPGLLTRIPPHPPRSTTALELPRSPPLTFKRSPAHPPPQPPGTAVLLLRACDVGVMPFGPQPQGGRPLGSGRQLPPQLIVGRRPLGGGGGGGLREGRLGGGVQVGQFGERLRVGGGC